MYKPRVTISSTKPEAHPWDTQRCLLRIGDRVTYWVKSSDDNWYESWETIKQDSRFAFGQMDHAIITEVDRRGPYEPVRV